jgi:hypothetical protein
MPQTNRFSCSRARVFNSRLAINVARVMTLQIQHLSQDGLMDVLAASAMRQKEIARSIAGELKEQDAVLDEIEDEVDDAEQVRSLRVD